MKVAKFGYDIKKCEESVIESKYDSLSGIYYLILIFYFFHIIRYSNLYYFLLSYFFLYLSTNFIKINYIN